jgi:hypothetical protein
MQIQGAAIRGATNMATKAEIIQAIAAHVQKCGGNYSQWYSGIAADPEKRLFNDHNVDKAKDAWIYRPCASSEEARTIEDHFVQQGMKGGPGGGDSTTKSVYAYKITNSTSEKNCQIQ